MDEGKIQPWASVSICTSQVQRGHGLTYLLRLVILSTRNSVIDGLTDAVADKRKCGASVSNGRVASAINGLPSDPRRWRLELPEALRAVYVDVVDILARGLDNILVNISKRVK